MTMIMTGVASTGGRVASLNRSARCSGWTRRLKEPLAHPQKAATTNMMVQVRAAEKNPWRPTPLVVSSEHL